MLDSRVVRVGMISSLVHMALIAHATIGTSSQAQSNQSAQSSGQAQNTDWDVGDETPFKKQVFGEIMTIQVGEKCLKARSV